MSQFGQRRTKPAERISMAASIILGLLFVVSGIGKLMNVASFVEAVRGLGVPYRLAYAAALVPPVEILLGLGLCLFVYNRRLAMTAAVLLAGFTAVFAFAYVTQGVSECGCFGELTFLQTSPLGSFVRNGILIGLSLFLWMRPVRPQNRPLSAKQAVALAVVGAFAFTLSGMSSLQPLYRGNDAAAADPFLNRPVAETPLGAVFPASPDSTYLVFVYSTTCTHCWNAVENVKAFQRTQTVDRVVGISAASEAALAAFYERFQPNFETARIEVDRMREITTVVPRAFLIERGTIRFAWTGGDIWSPFTFQDYRTRLVQAAAN